MVMGVIGWIVLGLTAGYIAGKQVNKDGEQLPMKIGGGIAGAVIGGWLFATFSPTEGTEFNLWSLLVAVVVAVVFLGRLARHPTLSLVRMDFTTLM